MFTDTTHNEYNIIILYYVILYYTLCYIHVHKHMHKVYDVNKPLSSLLISVVSSSESGRAGGR